MKNLDMYKHTESGGMYTFIGIVTPTHRDIANDYARRAKMESTLEEVKVERIMSYNSYEANVECHMVLYKSCKDGQLWLRPVNEFFGQNKHNENRFALVQQ